jgi:polysaccharide biosynthesis protein PelA
MRYEACSFPVTAARSHFPLGRSALFGLVVALAVLAGSFEGLAAETPHVATAFYYGLHLPSELLAHFDRVVVEPDNLATLPTGSRAQLVAYVSVGEINPTRPWRKDVPRSLVLAANPAWATEIVDTRNEQWKSFLLERVVEPLYTRGFRAVFLDALDSYERVTSDPSQRLLHARGIAAIIAAISGRHPEMKIIMNRGFAVLPLLATGPSALVAESLFHTADSDGVAYREVAPAETTQLLRALGEVRSRWNIPVTIIDYVAANDHELRRKTALRIWQAGFDPYVTTPALDSIGVGRVEIVPRRVLLLYKDHPEEGYLGQQDACVLVAPILEWMGYVVDYVDVRGPLPSDDIASRYAGIVTLVPDGVDDIGVYRRWILRQIDGGVRIAFLEGLGFEADGAFLARLGLTAARSKTKTPVTIASTSPYLGFEAPVRANSRELPPIQTNSAQVRSLLRLQDADGAYWDALVIGPWGGAAFTPYVVADDLEQERRWIINPFQFIRDALALPSIPAPDVTTESGRRILTVHIDGDAFVSRAERAGSPFAGQVILDDILKRYAIPHTISVVEGEVGPAGLYPSDSPRLEAIAREIFKLPYVELASHTFSHPFDWAAAEAGRTANPPATLPVPNYTFSVDRDLRGSIDYMNSRLAPTGKTVKVLLWSGDCSPSNEVVSFAQQLGVENVNGGGSTRTLDFPSLTRGSALGIPKGEGVYQVFAPVENENVYTNDWHGPYYGYEHAIETFELNERPRRLSIITIYYHFYSGVKTASLSALKRVYDWALEQETTRLYLSEYAAKVRAFQQVTLARHVDDDGWEIGNLGELRTLRVDSAWGWPDLNRSTGVAGARDVPQGRYLHLARNSAVLLYPSKGPPAAPYLDNANGRVLRWETSRSGTRIRLVGNEPLVFRIADARRCSLTTSRGTRGGTSAGNTVSFQLGARDTGEATLDCR